MAENPSPVAASHLEPPFGQSGDELHHVRALVRHEHRRAMSPPPRPRVLRRYSSLDTFDRLPAGRVSESRYSNYLPKIAPDPEPLHPRPLQQSVAESRYRDKVVEEVKPYPRKGKTRIPRRLVHAHAIRELGYPYEEEDNMVIIRLALSKEQIDQVIKRSREMKHRAEDEPHSNFEPIPTGVRTPIEEQYRRGKLERVAIETYPSGPRASETVAVESSHIRHQSQRASSYGYEEKSMTRAPPRTRSASVSARRQRNSSPVLKYTEQRDERTEGHEVDAAVIRWRNSRIGRYSPRPLVLETELSDNGKPDADRQIPTDNKDSQIVQTSSGLAMASRAQIGSEPSSGWPLTNEPAEAATTSMHKALSQPAQTSGLKPRSIGEKVVWRLTPRRDTGNNNNINNKSRDTKLAAEAQSPTERDETTSEVNPYGQTFRDKCQLRPCSDGLLNRLTPALYIIAVHDIEEDAPWVYRPSGYLSTAGLGASVENKESERAHVLRPQNPVQQTGADHGAGDSGPYAGSGQLPLENYTHGRQITERARIEAQGQSIPMQLLNERRSQERPRNSTSLGSRSADSAGEDQARGMKLPGLYLENPDSSSQMSKILRRPFVRRVLTGMNENRSGTNGDTTAAPSSVRWLDDPHMLPSILPEACVLKFIYPDPPPGEVLLETYVSRVAIQLRNRVQEWGSTVGKDTPILYIGHGVGGLVLQKAAPLRVVPQDIEIGYVFLNTPFPASPRNTYLAGSKYGIFPSNQSVRSYGLFEKAMSSRGAFLDDAIWRRFVATMGGHVQQLPIAWFYRRGGNASTSRFPDHMFFPLSGSSSSRFPGPNDPDYQSVIAQIRSLIALHASKYTRLGKLLRTSLEAAGFPKYVRDGQGQSPLHLAASSRNSEAVTFLIDQARRGRLILKNKDNDGRTPLHAALKAAAELASDKDHAHCQEIIRLLVWSSSNTGQRDRNGLTAWDHIDPTRPDHGWLDALRRTYCWASEDDFTLKPFGSPNVMQELACRKSRALVAEFLWTREDRNIRCNYGEKPVHELLYTVGPHKILLSTRPVDAGDVTFKWIHFPANNRLWVDDLFAGLGLQDSSMDNQQREGSTTPFKYFFSKAEEYTQAKITFKDSPTDEWPAAQAIISSSTSRPLKSDQSTVALFMPVLTFETKRNLDLLDKSIQDIAHDNIVEADDLQLDLAKAYIKDGLHPRRPLDQFSYTSRGEDQIMPTLGWNTESDREAPALMVDQLWLWILHDGTVVTCFSDTCDTRAEYNLKVILHDTIAETNRVKALEYLVESIIRNSVDFFARPGPQGATFVGCFQKAINYVVGLIYYWKRSAMRIKLITDMLKFHNESRLLMQIRDIQDELNIVKSIVEQQKGVLDQLSRAILTFYNNSKEYGTQGHRDVRQAAHEV
ncbi:hypothetical protein BDW71DRAFT_202829 [Aspergillus fruticulosus]